MLPPSELRADIEEADALLVLEHDEHKGRTGALLKRGAVVLAILGVVVVLSTRIAKGEGFVRVDQVEQKNSIIGPDEVVIRAWYGRIGREWSPGEDADSHHLTDEVREAIRDGTIEQFAERLFAEDAATAKDKEFLVEVCLDSELKTLRIEEPSVGKYRGPFRAQYVEGLDPGSPDTSSVGTDIAEALRKRQCADGYPVNQHPTHSVALDTATSTKTCAGADCTVAHVSADVSAAAALEAALQHLHEGYHTSFHSSEASASIAAMLSEALKAHGMWDSSNAHLTITEQQAADRLKSAVVAFFESTDCTDVSATEAADEVAAALNTVFAQAVTNSSKPISEAAAAFGAAISAAVEEEETSSDTSAAETECRAAVATALRSAFIDAAGQASISTGGSVTGGSVGALNSSAEVSVVSSGTSGVASGSGIQISISQIGADSSNVTLVVNSASHNATVKHNNMDVNVE